MFLGMRVWALSALACAVAAAPCFGRLNETYVFEEVCYVTLFNGTDGLTLREYAAGEGAGATLVSYNASDAITTYQEALELTSYYVIEYFIGNANALNKSLLSSRTVPLALRPPSTAHPTWRATMALAPSHWPAGKAPPKPGYGIELQPIGDGGGKQAVLLAVQRAATAESPQPADFDALCAKLYAAIKKQLTKYTFDETSPYSPTHARYFGYEYDGDSYEYECWLGVKRV
jgi:hypothetical protein